MAVAVHMMLYEWQHQPGAAAIRTLIFSNNREAKRIYDSCAVLHSPQQIQALYGSCLTLAFDRPGLSPHAC